MTAKLKPIEPKSMSANGARTSDVETRPAKTLLKRAKTAVQLPEAPSTVDTKPPSEASEATDESKESKKDEETVKSEEVPTLDPIPEVYKTQGTMTYSNCTGYSETTCLCTSVDDGSQLSSKRATYLERRNWITTERLCELRKKAQDAMKHHKTFTIRGCFYSIRKGLVQRGWVEKLDIHRRAPVNGTCQVILEDVTQHLPQRRPGETRRQHIQKCERNIQSRFLEHMPIDFLWSARKEKTDWIDMARNPNLTQNKFHKSPFTTKEGLCNVLRDLHWFVEEGKSETYYPRSYNVWNQDDLNDFCDDYRLTACMSMLRYLVENDAKETDAECLYMENGQIPLSSIRFAIKQCREYVRFCQHLDIDEDSERVWNHDWELFFMHFQMLTHEKLKFQQPTDGLQWNLLMEECKRHLNEMAEHWPQAALDGVLNIWIVKPSNRCRGRGILLMNDIKKIIAHVNPPVVNKGRWVVQKYIERPMIIYNCKFDVRQWFLVTSVQPLIIWMYKESYLRFSSQEYDLVNFHESVHLTNHAVQKRYENGKRDERLPRENMWDCHSFQAYLRQIGKASMWSERIYPGMQKALIGTMLASQDTMDRRSNTFELFGADFMISEDCQPWLIEINASPDLGASTSVTARLCPQCLEDVIKVVIDYRNDPKSSTGSFEMIYRQVIPPAPAYLGLNLFLKGTQMLPKNFAGKKEKPKVDVVKLKNDRRNSQLYLQSTRESLLNADNEKSITLSPRSFVVDFNEIQEKKSVDSPMSSRKNTQLKAITTIKKSTVEALGIGKDLKSPRSRANAVMNRENMKVVDTLKDTNLNGIRKVLVKCQDSARRHASCGPRLMSNAPTDEAKTEDGEANTNMANSSGIRCVGNKCGPESETAAPISTESTTNNPLTKELTSPRKSSVETPRTTINIRTRLKPINTLSKSNMSKQPVANNLSDKQAKTNVSTATAREYRKYLTQSNIQLNKFPPKLPIHENYYNSHFFAVGLSLRAWRSKYSRILANGTKNDAANSSNTTNTVLKTRKAKKTV